MKLMIGLQQIAQTQLNGRTEYWIDMFDERIRLYLWHPLGFEFWDLRVALDILIEDSAKNYPQSNRIKKAVSESISSTINRHPLYKFGNRRSELFLLRGELERNEAPLAHDRARNILRDIDSEGYSDELIQAISNTIENNEALTERIKSDLLELATDSVGRLFRAGFGRYSIADAIRRIFCVVIGNAPGQTTHFPRRYVTDDNKIGTRSSWEALTEEEVASLGNLSLRDRIGALKHFMHPVPKQITCIFGIDGLSGYVTTKLGPVSFYSPALERRLSGNSDAELMGKSPELKPVNASITVSAVDDDDAKEQAHALVNQILDLANIGTVPNAAMKISKTRVFLVDPTSLALYGYSEVIIPKADNLHFTTKSIEAIVSQVEDLHAPADLLSGKHTSGMAHEIATSLHWLRRADEASTPEDRLLFYWIAFEKLFFDPRRSVAGEANGERTFDSIDKMYPIIDSFLLANMFDDLIAGYVRSFWDSGMTVGWAPRFDQHGFATLIGSEDRSSSKVTVKKVRDAFSTIKPSRFRDNLSVLFELIDDGAAASKELSHAIHRSKREVHIIYWLRNRLVHGGEFAFPAIRYYTAVLELATRRLLRIISDTRNWGDTAEHPVDVLRSLYLRGTSLVRGLADGNGTVAQILAREPTVQLHI